MSLHSDYTGCTVLLYSPEGDYLGEDVISVHDRKRHWVELKGGMPPFLKVDEICTLFFLAQPTPVEYRGKVVRDGLNYSYALFKGKEKDNRRAVRYKLTFIARIMALIVEGEIYPLQVPESVTTLDISRSGIRFRAKNNTMRVGDRFVLRMTINEEERLFTAVVVNNRDEAEYTEYGCRLVMGLKDKVS